MSPNDHNIASHPHHVDSLRSTSINIFATNLLECGCLTETGKAAGVGLGVGTGLALLSARLSSAGIANATAQSHRLLSHAAQRGAVTGKTRVLLGERLSVIWSVLNPFNGFRPWMGEMALTYR